MAENEKILSEVTLQQFFDAGRDRLGISLVAGQSGMDRIIRETPINRPGLALAGFYKYFPVRRIQLIGWAEYSYIMSLEADLRSKRLEALFATRVPCVVYTRRRNPDQFVKDLADKYSVPLFKTNMITGHFTNATTILLEELTAPRTRIHATMMEVAGIGVLIEGEPGVGKSETALGLIKRGYALVADDCVEVRRTSADRLVGAAIPVTQYYMEIRGLGIIYVPSIFGVASVRGEKRIDMVVTLKRQKEYDSEIDRTGANNLIRNFHGIEVPQVIIPVAPGRDIVNIVETVAQEYKLRISGQVAYQNLDNTIKRHNSKV